MWIKYALNGAPAVMPWNEENEAAARAEADNGDISIDDDGVAAELTQEQRIADLEEALALLLSGVTE